MDISQRIELALDATVTRATSSGCPKQLAAALSYAVFPGGARVRPRLCLAVATACGDEFPLLADSAAAAIELLHCASLVHDDMPCFDNAEMRRGRPSVHKKFGEPVALLTGDALIVAAFELLGRCIPSEPVRAARLLSIVGSSVGSPSGIISGQAWECEETVPLAEYHRAKTGSLFAAATTAGALSGGGQCDLWRTLGEKLGEAYQIADDICDMVADPAIRGKPANRDADRGKPNAADALGLDGAIQRLKRLLGEAVECVPACPGQAELRVHIARSAQPYLPKELALVAA